MRVNRKIEVLPRYLGLICIFLISTLFSVQAFAQDDQHGVGVGKACPTATKVGDTAMCTLSVTNEDDFGDTLDVLEFWDVADPQGNDGGPIRVPAVGSLPIIEVINGTCTAAPVDEVLAPIGLVFPCTLDGVVGQASGGVVRVASIWTIPAGATDPVIDQGNVIVVDGCNLQPVGCSTEEQQQQFGAAVSLFVPSLEASKTGPDIAKAGDEITYTIGFTDTTTGTGFPGFENCTGDDTLLGDLGVFTPGVTRDFLYTVQPDDPDPLPNTVTISCGVVNFDNVVTDSASHNVDLIEPEIDVTKTGPPLAKVGDEITYTIGFTATNDAQYLGVCTGDDTLLGDLGVFVSGETRDFLYTVQAGDANPLPNTATITCAVEGFNNEVSDFADHSVDLIAPAIEVTKEGPAVAKWGDEITYTIGFTAIADGGFLGECTGSDTLLGDLGVFVSGQTRDFLYTIDAGDEDPLPNTATITCAVEGFANTASDSADHSVEVIGPEIDVTKEGPALAKVGDEITYTIGFTATADAEYLGECTGVDTLLGDLGVFVSGQTRDFLYTVQGGDADPLPNTATITCQVEGFNNTASDFADHSVDLIAPEIDVTKTGPDVAKVGDEITYTIGFTATADGGFLGECTGSDTLLGDLGVFVSGQTRDFLYTVQGGDANPLPNTATITCEVEGFVNTASDSADHSVDLIGPEIDVTKEGPAFAKVGDEITYTIGFTAVTDGGFLGECTGVDTLLGDLGVFVSGQTRDFLYTVQGGDADPLPNTATITCAVEGFANTASDSADHSVDLIAPEIDVTKEGPDMAKVGDEITYTIGFTAVADGGFLGECTGSDTLLGDLGVFVSGQTRDFLYTVLDTDADPLPNTATITCAVEGFANTASDSADHSVDLIHPAVDLAKVCRPDPVRPGETIYWDITVSNPGDISLDCMLNDVTAGITDEMVTVAAGGTEVVTTSRTVEAADVPVISNTATVNCPIADFNNEVADEAAADCEVLPTYEICRTPGFWGTHAGTEKRKSTDLVQVVIDAAGGTIMVCGEPITNTHVPDVESSTEAICVSPSGEQRLQLARHLTAAALNCVVSGGGADCTGISIGADWAAANDVCINGGDYSYWGDIIDEWNNGEECHERELSESDVFDGVSPLPGPAGSPNACNLATSNNVTIFD